MTTDINNFVTFDTLKKGQKHNKNIRTDVWLATYMNENKSKIKYQLNKITFF